MAQSIFDATLDVNNQIKVNTFDWSHSNNLTTQIGRITPIFCELVPNKGSIRVNPRFGLQLMPMAFPVQTPMRARIAFFKYPLRALWKGYRDFVGNFRQGLEEPYLNLNTSVKLKKMASTGSLGDYLGLPTTVFGKFGGSNTVAFDIQEGSVKGNVFGGSPEFTYLQSLPVLGASDLTFLTAQKALKWSQNTGILAYKLSTPAAAASTTDEVILNRFSTSINKTTLGTLTDDSRFIFSLRFDSGIPLTDAACESWYNAITGIVSSSGHYDLNKLSYKKIDTIDEKGIDITFSYPQETINKVNKATTNPSFYMVVNWFNQLGRRIAGNNTAWSYSTKQLSKDLPAYNFIAGKNASLNNRDGYLSDSTGIAYDYNTTPVDLTLETSPYYNSDSSNKDKQIKISAYAFRAYEGIYNSYYRDNRNNPYYINGEVQYNQWIPTDEGGADNNLYDLHYANWEKDFLTTAVQSPQQGTAPLVGITTYTETVSDESTGLKSEISRVALVDEEGKRYQVAFDSDQDGLQGVKYVELDNDVKLRQPRNLFDVATSGISINDLRNVNAYQKFLELNMRKGYSYRDIIEGRFDVKVRYDELLMPEFFGGCSRDIDMHSITQTVDQQSGDDGSYKNALGSQSGVAGVRGDSNNSIEVFCDEESIVMGVLIVTPLPVYTQLLPKHFTYRGLLDHYQPEFNHIGFQPILYKEVCPIQAYNDNPDSLTDTFGYNRPWYEYVQKYDVAHGLFRTDLSNFLMHRVFNEKPQLAQSFLLIDPEQVTDVFSVTETTDKVYGQIYFDCTAKLPISRVAIPRLD